jgi:TPP-dependent pyruvate/acetoin dehydrogenase alpha subunit
MASILTEQLERQTAVPDEFALTLYRKLLTLFYVEDRMKTFARQGKCSFVASSRGHEVTQAGIAALLKPGHDWFFTYYRSKATAVGIGLPLTDIFMECWGGRVIQIPADATCRNTSLRVS